MAEHTIKYVAQTDNYNRNVRKAKAETKDFQAAVKGLERQFGLSISQLGKFTAAAGAITGAMKLVKVAMKMNESAVDEWGRTMEKASSLYNGFVNALNNNSFGTFISNIGNITEAAEKAYDALDKLNTMSTIIANSNADIDAQMSMQKAIIKRFGKDSAQGKAAQQRIIELEGEKKSNFNESASNYKDAYLAKLNQRMKETGVALTPEMIDALNDPSKWNKLAGRAKGSLERRFTGQNYVTVDTRNNVQKFMDAFGDEFQKEISSLWQGFHNSRKSYYDMVAADSRYLDGGGGGSSSFSAKLGSMPDMWIKQLNHGKNFMNIKDFATQQINTLNADATQLPPLQIDVDIKGAENWRKLMKFLDTAEQLENTGKGLSMVFNEASEAISAFGGESREAAIAASALTFAGTISQLMASFANMMTRSTTIWEWIAGGLSGVTALGTMVASMKQINSQKFADGGVVGGDSYSGDRINARLNSGEVVFNQSDASKLYSMVHGSSLGVGSHTVKVKGSDMYILMSNYAKETGKRL